MTPSEKFQKDIRDFLKESGIAPTTLSQDIYDRGSNLKRFMTGERKPTLASVDKFYAWVEAYRKKEGKNVSGAKKMAGKKPADAV